MIHTTLRFAMRQVQQGLVLAGFMASALVAVGTAQAATEPAPRPALALAAGMAPHAASAPRKGPPPKPVKLVDINSASRAELKTLPGIGDAEAERLIAARPFLSKAELVTKKVITTGPYLSLKNRVIAKQNTQQNAKLKAPAKP